MVETGDGRTAELVVTSTLKDAQLVKVDAGATYTYVGAAVCGTATSSALWQVKRVTNASGDVVWADGDGSYNNVWDNRASLSYS